MQRFTLLVAIALVAACGDMPIPKSSIEKEASTDVAPTVRFDAAMQTPGYFRDTFRLLAAQRMIDDETAVHRLLIELPARIQDRGALPPMFEIDIDTIDGLLILAYRSVQSTADTPRTARHIGEGLLYRTLALDPARVAWNSDHGPDEQVEVLEGGAQTLADATLWAIAEGSDGAPTLCATAASSNASWDPGESEIFWIAERCEPDRMVGGYCEQDQWIEGNCTDVWMPESCSGGYWEDNGYYEYYCYNSDDCRYIWREQWDYVDGYCDGGYYDTECGSGYWEYGLCYEGTFVPGYCIPGHYEYRFPGGTWHFVEYVTTPQECTSVRPGQLVIAATGAGVIRDKAYADLEPEWQSALDELHALGMLGQPDEAAFDAIEQVLSSAVD